jgi:hypothetical protein
MLGDVGDLNTCLIMAPGEHDIIETAMRLVDSILCRIDHIVRIWVCLKGLGVYDLVREAAADDECVLLKE